MPEDKKLSVVMDSQEDIPEMFQEFYTKQSNGKWLLTAIAGVKTQEDIDRVMTAKKQEADNHKKTKEELKAVRDSLGVWSELKPEEITALVTGYDELKIKAESAGQDHESKIAEIVETRIKARIAPIEKERNALTEQLKTATEQIGTYQQKEIQRTIHDEVRRACVDSKVLDTAVEDALALAERVFEVGEDGHTVTVKDQVGYTPGVDPKTWLTEIQTKRPHWWPESSGGGSKGGSKGVNGIQNPWSATNWNMTAQGEYVKQHGVAKATQMAQLAGVQLGALGPAATK